MKKLFIIALSIFTLVAFTTPAVAGGTSGNGTAFNGHVEGLAMMGAVAPGHTAGIAVDGALAAGYAGDAWGLDTTYKVSAILGLGAIPAVYFLKKTNQKSIKH